MVKSTSCFKIITCGSDSADKDDLEVPERKGSNDKRGWSFRKKSAQQRVLSNTVTLETPSGNKERPESASFSYPPPANSNVQDKFSAIQSLDEKPQLSASPKPKVMETIVVCENDSKLDLNTEESVVIVIQAAIRGFLGQQMLWKIKNVIKLQAIVRGHLVRCHAVGTLRCVKAIVKMQALVRARRARISVEGSCPEKKLDENHREENKSKTREKESPVNKSTITYISIEKLLSNGFARQLLESTPKTKPIHVKCDPSKPDSAWKWLERWMSVSSPSTAELDKASSPSPAESDKVELISDQEERGKDDNFVSPVETKSTAELDKASSPSPAESDKVELITGQEEREKDKNFVSSVETKSPSEVFPESQNVNSSNKESEGPPESEDNLITYNPGSFSFQACHPISSPRKDEFEQCCPDANQTLLEVISPSNQSTPADSKSHVEFNAPSMKPETETEEPKRSMKRLSTEELETEGKKYVFGSRKVSNPAFVAAQSKFEELSTTANSGGSISSSDQDAGIESLSVSSLHNPGVELISDTIFSGAETVINTKEPTMVETSAPDSSRTQVGGSECGTELSITSTLDSPDRPEDGAAECEHEAKVFEDGICNPNSMENDKLESKNVSIINSSNLSPFMLDEAEKCGYINGASVTLMVAMDSPQTEHKVENNATDMQRQLNSETGHQPNRSSPEASPRSHITIPESHWTPSSQVSVNGKKNRTEKSGSDRKRRSLSGGKKSPSIPNHDSGSRSSMEQLPKDQRNGNRRNSFGSPRSDHIEQEPRDSGSNNSIPRFMQATESARAKAQANSTPRSSPDVQDGDIYVKKRHSLPGANGRQGSPRIERSMSQAQQSAKGNGTYHHERKWQR